MNDDYIIKKYLHHILIRDGEDCEIEDLKIGHINKFDSYSGNIMIDLLFSIGDVDLIASGESICISEKMMLEYITGLRNKMIKNILT